MAAQKVGRFCHSCVELYDENNRFCVTALNSEGNNGLRKNKRPKSLDEYMKEKGKEWGFSEPKFLQSSNKSSKSNWKTPNSRAE